MDRTTSPVAPALLNEAQAAALFGVSARKFSELRAAPWMPRPIALGPRALRWSRVELEAAIAHAPRLVEPLAEPLPLAKARAARAGRTVVAV